MVFVGHVARTRKRRCLYRVLVGKPEGKGPLGRHRRRWEYNNKKDIQDVGYGGIDWNEQAQHTEKRFLVGNPG
jgi:hypothetical protein